MIKQQIRFCRTVDGVRLAYAVAGSGPPLVKPPHWLSHIEYEWECPVWRHWHENLARHFTLIRYDLRGCGLSDREVETISFQSLEDDLETVIKAAGLTRFSMLGISQGGAVAVAFAGKSPKKIRRLVLYGSCLRGRLRRPLTRGQFEETQILARLIKLGWNKKTAAFRQVFASLQIPDASPVETESLNELHKASTTAETAVRIVHCFDRMDITGLAAGITAPTLIIHARDDALVPIEEGRMAATLISGARFISLESKNHILLKRDPAWPFFLSSLLAFTGKPEDKENKAESFSKLSLLTRREKQVLHLIARGLKNSQIAARLYISPMTVRNHITNIFAKLGIDNRPAAIVFSREAGMGRK